MTNTKESVNRNIIDIQVSVSEEDGTLSVEAYTVYGEEERSTDMGDTLALSQTLVYDPADIQEVDRWTEATLESKDSPMFGVPIELWNELLADAFEELQTR